MGTVTTGWEDRGDHLRVYADIPLRRNGLPNHACREAAEALLKTLTPAAYDPIEPIPEHLARAAKRDMRWESPSGRQYATRMEAVQNGEQIVAPIYADDTGACEYVEISAEHPPLPDFGIPIVDAGLLPDDDEVVFPRACPAGGCGED